MSECQRCDGYRYVEDPTACGDEDHCSGWMPCPDCWDKTTSDPEDAS